MRKSRRLNNDEGAKARVRVAAKARERVERAVVEAREKGQRGEEQKLSNNKKEKKKKALSFQDSGSSCKLEINPMLDLLDNL